MVQLVQILLHVWLSFIANQMSLDLLMQKILSAFLCRSASNFCALHSVIIWLMLLLMLLRTGVNINVGLRLK